MDNDQKEKYIPFAAMDLDSGVVIRGYVQATTKRDAKAKLTAVLASPIYENRGGIDIRIEMPPKLRSLLARRAFPNVKGEPQATRAYLRTLKPTSKKATRKGSRAGEKRNLRKERRYAFNATDANTEITIRGSVRSFSKRYAKVTLRTILSGSIHEYRGGFNMYVDLPPEIYHVLAHRAFPRIRSNSTW